MWSNVCARRVLVLAMIASDISAFKISEPRSKDQIYVDVLKNITYVNDILKDLIDNYKHLKEIYKAKARSENELSVERDVDDENVRKNNQNNGEEFHPVTQMILTEEDLPEESIDQSNDDLNGKDIEIIQSSEKNENIINSEQLSIQNTESPINLANKPELIVIGTALKYIQNKLNIESEDDKTADFTSASQVENSNLMKPILRVGNNYVDKLTHTINRYRDQIQGKKWQSSDDFSLHGSIRKKDMRNDYNNTTVFVFIVNKNNKYETDFENSEEEMLRKDQLERKILRDAYGSACLKVAVRKCYKTLVQVRKLICSKDFKCKDSFKDVFNSNSKDGCMKEFNYNGNEENKDIQSHITKRKRPNINNKIFDNTARSRSNINYYELCLPVMMSKETNDSSLGKLNSLHSDRIQPINVLRDHYEKECKRMSTEKCERACNYAIVNTCGPDACDRHDQKIFMRTCRHECKHAFYESIPDSDRDDDSDSDSDIDSEDDSEDSEDSGRDSILE